MSEYDKLLDKALKAAEVFRASAGEFVPKMYEALRREGVDAADAKDKIEKDLAGVWSKDTIRRQIPDEAKDEKKQKAAVKSNELRKSAGKNPAQMIAVAAGGHEEFTIANSDKPEIISEPYSAGAKKDREATYTERQTALIAELKGKLFSEQNLNSELKRKIDSMKNSGYNDDVTQELIDAQIKIKKLEEGYSYETDVEVNDQWLPLIVFVRPSNKTAKVVVNVPKLKEMHA